MENIILEPENSLTINENNIAKVKEKDPLFAQYLEQAKASFISLLRTTPGYTKLVMDKLQEGDIYIAKISKEAREGLQQGKYDKMLKNDSGLWNGMIRNPNVRGKPIVEQTDWQQVNLSHEFLSNVTLITLQASVAQVTEQLFEIDQKLNQVLSYQQTDRISKAVAGIQIYEQAYYAEDPAIQAMQLSNALQSLTEARTSLMLHLETFLGQTLREDKFTDHFWRIIGVDKKAFDFQRTILQNYDLIKEDIQYINLASIYIFRSQTLLKQRQSAYKSKQQYLDFCNTLVKGIAEKKEFLPYETETDFSLDQISEQFDKVQLSVSQLSDSRNDLVIEVEYRELLENDRM
jgi:hypothetical protein